MGRGQMGHTDGVSFESEHVNLVALATEIGEREIRVFAASEGPWFGFNGRYIYLVTNQSLWRSRAGLRSLVGGEPSVTRFPLADCSAELKGDRTIVMTTSDGTSTVALATSADARAVAALLTRG